MLRDDGAMSDSNKIPVAVIGVGRMGRHHARNYHEMPEADLVAVVDADADRAGDLADQYSCAEYRTVDDLFAAADQGQVTLPKAVTVAVPTIYHEPVAGQCIERGISCLVEKPLAQSGEVGRKLVETANQHDVVLQVGHTERFNPAVRAIRNWDFRPRFIECDRVSPMTFRSVDVGVVFDMMIHDLDIILMLARSPVKRVDACGISLLGDAEDIADARIVFEDGCVAKITSSRMAMKTERKLRVFSESGYVTLDYATKSGLSIQRTGNIEALLEVRKTLSEGADLSDLDYSSLLNIEQLTINDEEPLRAELTNFLAAVRGEENPEVAGTAGLAAVELAEQVVAQIQQHEWMDFDPSSWIESNA